jgi:hypothetical protein
MKMLYHRFHVAGLVKNSRISELIEQTSSQLTFPQCSCPKSDDRALSVFAKIMDMPRIVKKISEAARGRSTFGETSSYDPINYDPGMVSLCNGYDATGAGDNFFERPRKLNEFPGQHTNWVFDGRAFEEASSIS